MLRVDSSGLALAMLLSAIPPTHHVWLRPTWPNDGLYAGLSSLSRRPDGVLWATTERTHVMLPVSITPQGATALAAPVPIAGVPTDVDLESITWLGPNTAALGTERKVEGRASDDILVVQVSDKKAAVTRTIRVPYDSWGFAARGNHGIEGLCYAGGQLFAAIEHVETDATSGRRYAPIARLDLAAADDPPPLRAYRLWLSSDTGKISGLDCRAGSVDGASVIEFVAIERHFGISHILRFTLPSADPTAVLTDISPTVVADLAADLAAVNRSVNPNWEGIVWLDDRQLVLISDNQYGGKLTDTWALHLTIDATAEHP